MENKSEWKITSIGSICASRYRICEKSGLEYIVSPFDNAENMTVHEFENIMKLMKDSFSMISRNRLRALKEREVYGMRINTNSFKHFYGYNYVLNDLARPFILGHFFDNEDGSKMDFDNAWSRWEHKVNKFMEYMRNVDVKLVLMNFRLCDDDDRERQEVLESFIKFGEFLKEEYGRGPENTLVVNEIISFSKSNIEYEDPMMIQFVAQDDPNLINIPYFERNSNNGMYFEKAMEVLKKRGIL